MKPLNVYLHIILINICVCRCIDLGEIKKTRLDMMIERDLLDKMDKAITYLGFKNRTEFIKAAIREKLDFETKKKALIELRELRDKTTKEWKPTKTTRTTVEEIREEEDQAV